MDMFIKTTVMIPESLFQAAKIKAVREKTTLSKLLSDGLKDKISEKRTGTQRKIDPKKTLGVFSLGISKIYNKRSDLYEDHIKRKMGL